MCGESDGNGMVVLVGVPVDGVCPAGVTGCLLCLCEQVLGCCVDLGGASQDDRVAYMQVTDGLLDGAWARVGGAG